MGEDGVNYRKDLVTVPACDAHNSKKSKDDEYFRAVVAMLAVQSSPIGQSLFFGKLLRGVKRAPHVYSTFFQDQGPIGSTTARAVRIDRQRLDACFDHMARALFFDSFRSKWGRPIVFASPSFYSSVGRDGLVPHESTARAVDVTRRLLGVEDIRGANPDIFKYRVQYDQDDDAFAFAAIFYDCVEVFGFSSRAMTAEGDSSQR
jgi:hypothetical protein